MSDATATTEGSKQSNAYDLFMLVLTVISLVIMVPLLPGSPLSDATKDLLRVYDNLICVVFLGDFAARMIRTKPRRAYFLGQRGWLDLIGSIPTLPNFQVSALFRLARLSRLARISRILREKDKRALARDVVTHRGRYAWFVTVLAAIIVVTTASVIELQVEGKAPDANITTGGGALWWSVVTITTVGYGDEYPVTPAGRITAVMVMFAGVGIIGALASILASVLVPPPADPTDADPASSSGLQAQLEDIKRELTALREAMVSGGAGPPA
jgi:voltage-gated potassium channel Kch